MFYISKLERKGPVLMNLSRPLRNGREGRTLPQARDMARVLLAKGTHYGAYRVVMLIPIAINIFCRISTQRARTNP